MSYKSDLQTNNTSLQSILNTINSLPSKDTIDGIIIDSVELSAMLEEVLV